MFVKLNASMRNCSLTPGGDGKLAREPEVPVEHARRAQDVVAGVAEPRFVDLGKRRGIVVRRSAAGPTELDDGLHLVRGLGAARQVQRRVVGEHAEGWTAHHADQVVHLPPAHDIRKHAAVLQPPPVGAEREFPRVGDPHVVGAIGADERVVAARVRQRLNVRRERAVLVVALGPRQGVVHAQAEAVGEPPMQLRLHRVVLPLADGLQEHGGRRPAVLLLQGPAFLAGADDLAGIDVSEPELPCRVRAHVPDLAGELPRQLPLDCEIPRLDVPAVQLLADSPPTRSCSGCR